MGRIFNRALLAAGSAILIFGFGAYATMDTGFPGNNSPENRVFAGKIVSIRANDPVPGSRTIQVEMISGPDKGKLFDIIDSGLSAKRNTERPGETLILGKNSDFEAAPYYIIDHYRLPSLILIISIFIAAVIIFAGLRGAGSLLGMGVSILILAAFIVPRILGGADPLLVSFIGSLAIILSSQYFAHGFNRRTTIAVGSTTAVLLLSIAVSAAFAAMAKLIGLVSAESFYLQLAVGELNLRGLLLAGIIIGMLGVLDDITIGQAATVEEIHRADPRLGFRELCERGLKVGREHIASLVNTLFLAYVGSSLPLFLLFVANSAEQPLWLLLNNESIAEEIIRSVTGSLALIFAVPITTALSAYVFSRRADKTISSSEEERPRKSGA